MKTRKTALLAISVLLLTTLITACSPSPQSDALPTTAPIAPPVQPPSDDDGGDEDFTPPRPQPDDGAVGDGSGTGGARVHMVNDTIHTICYVYLSGTWETDWGTDWLDGNYVDPGQDYNFYVNPGTWDLRAEHCQGGVLEEAFSVGIPASGLEWTVDAVEGGGNIIGPSVTITNSTGSNACYMYIASSGAPDWGEDWLGPDIFYAGETRTYYTGNDGYFDILFEDCSQNSTFVVYNFWIGVGSEITAYSE